MNAKYLMIVLLFVATIASAQDTVRVFTIGDSTMANKKAEVFPETGWTSVGAVF